MVSQAPEPVAVISDIHGNDTALDATLREISRLGIDHVVCLGDSIDPFPGSRRVLKTLSERAIPMIRGNHEDYVIAAFEDPAHEINTKPQFKPVRRVAQDFSADLIGELRQLPLSLAHPQAREVLFCHASPQSNRSGWRDGVDDDLARELGARPEAVLVCGHWHATETRVWKSDVDPSVDKTLVICGSVGLSHSGNHDAEFLVLEPNGSQGWHTHHRTTPYDFERTARDYVDSGWCAEGGFFAKLLLAELVSGVRQISPFFAWLKEAGRKVDSEAHWDLAVDQFLESRVQSERQLIP